MPQTLHCVILYSENFHRDDQKAAKKAGIETLVIANFHYTDKIKAVDIQYKAADNDKGLQILTFNWKRPKGMAHANVLRGSCGRRGSSPARAVRPKAEERRHTANTQHLSRDRLVTDRTRPLKGGQHANPTQESRTLPERGHAPRVAAVATAVID